MKALKPRASLTDETYRAIRDSILDGSLAEGAHIVQEQIARDLEVSRQPVQQAMTLLKREGLLVELGRRGLFVAPLDARAIAQHYEIRAALDALAARLAAARVASSGSRDLGAEIAAQGAAIVTAGLQAIARGSIADMVRQDVAFHHFIYEASGNPLIAGTADKHWQFLRRVMAEVLRKAAPPPTVWQQHQDVLAAIAGGKAELAAQLAAAHVQSACSRLTQVLGNKQTGSATHDERAS